MGNGIDISDFLNDTSMPDDIGFILRTSIISEIQFLKIKKIAAFHAFENKLGSVPIMKYVNDGHGFERNIFNINDINNYKVDIDNYTGEASKNLDYKDFGFLNFEDSDGGKNMHQYVTTKMLIYV